MAGIATILNIGKEALLAQQTAVNVASNNIANVDTDGYSRQSVTLTTATPSSVAVGNLGNGVLASGIARQYDQFIAKQLVTQNSTTGYLSAQQEVYQVAESIFNETDDTGGVNDLLNQFWDSWQTLADNPEIDASRQGVIQQGQLLVDKLQGMNDSIGTLRTDINTSMAGAVEQANTLAAQIAKLNGQISATETPTSQANDLRDQRDQLTGELASLVDITTIETGNGATKVMLADGHALVDGTEAAQLGWSDSSLTWSGSADTTATAVSGKVALGGKIGGYLDLLDAFREGDPSNTLGKFNAFANAMIREVNQQYAQGVGTVPFTGELESCQTGDTALLSTTVATGAATTAIDAGAVTVNGIALGGIAGGAAVNGLAMTKAANTVTAVNNAAAGVTARLTTLVSGSAPVTGLAAGETVDFTVNGIAVSYAATTDESSEETATNLVAAINNAIAAHNGDPATGPAMTITAEVGDGGNGGETNSIVLRNTVSGDGSQIVIDGLDPQASGEAKLALANGTFTADATHNTGEVALFSTEPMTITAGSDDSILSQLGLGGGGVASDDEAGDGRLTFTAADHAVSDSLLGLAYGGEITTDNSGFDLWLYDSDGSPALAAPVHVDLDRATTLDDVADAINGAVAKASGASSLLTASVRDGRLVLTPASGHGFAFANDTSNFLSSAELNTFFTGSDAGSIGINQTVADNLDYLAAGQVSDTGEIYSGDNSNALLVGEVRDREDVAFTGATTPTTLDQFYNTLVSGIGAASQAVNDSVDYNSTLTDQLNTLRDSVSGVSLDEEMANLVKYQQAYAAAAKLISMADDMMQTLMDTI